MSGRFGMIVRADMGGLGNLTKSLWRQLQPDVAYVVHLPEPRGKDEPIPFGFHVQHPFHPLFFRQMCQEIGSGGTLLTVETMYCDDAYRIAREEGVRTILYAMPELYAGDPADVIIVPTPWELGRMPQRTQVLAMPTDSARHRIRTECTTFLHHVAPAMLDRSGSEIVDKAMRLMSEPCTMIWHQPANVPPIPPLQVGPVKVTTDTRWHDNLWDSYPLEADVMILPRRYGGLSMPTQEAASTGLPSIMPMLKPQTWWGGVEPFMVNAPADVVSMKGGQFAVHKPDAFELARTMDSFVRGERDVHGLSEDAYHWARSISWSAMLADWVKLCRG